MLLGSAGAAGAANIGADGAIVPCDNNACALGNEPIAAGTGRGNSS